MKVDEAQTSRNESLEKAGEAPDMQSSGEAKQAKIFALNDCEWWAGYDLESTKAAFLAEDYGDEGSFGDPHELPDAELDRLTWVADLANFPEGDVPITFRERLKQMVDDGKGFPCFFASTEF